MKCRHCGTVVKQLFGDLGFSPPSNAYLSREDLSRPEKYYPLRVWVCEACWLVQTEDFAQADDLFRSDYAYFSGTSRTWREHTQKYVEHVVPRFSLGKESFVVEIASNDGHLLRNFVHKGVPCLGIEPTASTAHAAELQGISVLRGFFGEALGRRLSEEEKKADLIIGNNVYAHIPDINDFTRGLKVLLKPDGCITLEFPHLLRLIEQTQFDTIYHEHFSYLSLSVVCRIFEKCGLHVWDVEELPTHGGSLRIYGCHQEDPRKILASVQSLLDKERAFGLQNLAVYRNFQARADRVKNDFLAFLIEKKREGRRVAAYGAAAKGNTLLNYAGVRGDLLSYVCDAAEAKQGKFLPGSHIPIVPPDRLLQDFPDYVCILPWNIADEVVEQNAPLMQKGTKFVTFVPELRVVSQ